MELGVNIDHVATLRQARGTDYPDPTEAARIAEDAGANLITLHLREDRRHIIDSDVESLRKHIKTRMNLEIGATKEMISIACRVRPDDVCLVPERREELTTEGGLDVIGNQSGLLEMTASLKDAGIRVSMFIDPDIPQIEASLLAGADAVELHTGAYAETTVLEEIHYEHKRLVSAAIFASTEGLRVNAGHGLHYGNAGEIAEIVEIMELNIGHSIIAKAIFSSLSIAVSDMKILIDNASSRAQSSKD